MLTACGSAEKREPAETSDRTAAATPPSTPETKPAAKPLATGPRGGAYYLDDGPGDNPPPDLDKIPDAIPKLEPLNRGTARPYSVMGRSYTPMTTLGPYRARGTATWYGRRYHGLKTSSGEPYDMYAMTAAHTILPIPSYVRVTSLANGRTVVVRVNDRGPFIGDRLIDLSYTAAWKLGLLASGSGLNGRGGVGTHCDDRRARCDRRAHDGAAAEDRLHSDDALFDVDSVGDDATAGAHRKAARDLFALGGGSDQHRGRRDVGHELGQNGDLGGHDRRCERSVVGHVHLRGAVLRYRGDDLCCTRADHDGARAAVTRRQGQEFQRHLLDDAVGVVDQNEDLCRHGGFS